VVDQVVHPNPVRTRIIRTPVSGPDPANTLVYLECDVAGAEGHGAYGQWYGVRDTFRTQFKIDGFQQQNYDWYKENTLVSATAMLRKFTTTTDLIFSGGLDEITPTLELDGTLSFTTLWSIYVDDEAWFPESGNSLEMGYRISAYVLCFEPRADPPRGGHQRSPWGRITDVPLGIAGKAADFRAADDQFRTTLVAPERDESKRESSGDSGARPRVRRRRRRAPGADNARPPSG
jgi:hypothetical protein